MKHERSPDNEVRAVLESVENEDQVLFGMYRLIGDVVIGQLASAPANETVAKLERSHQPIQSGSDPLTLDRFLTTKRVI
jgi:hypothetical protein